MLCDRSQIVLSTAGILLWCQAQPGPKLGASFELFEVAYSGHYGRSGDRPDAHELRGLARLLVFFEMRGNALIAPGNVVIKFVPLGLRTFNDQAGHADELIAGIFRSEEHTSELQS